jgi:hypothetical protein
LNTSDNPPAPTGEQSRFKHHPPGAKEKAFGMYARHTDLAAISSKLGVPLATLRKWSSVGTWKARRLLLESANPAGASGQKSNSKETETDEAFEELKAMSLSEKQAMYQKMMADSAMRGALVMQRSSDTALVQFADRWLKMDTTARKALRLETIAPPMVVNVALLAGTETRRAISNGTTNAPLALPAIQAFATEVPALTQPDEVEQ